MILAIEFTLGVIYLGTGLSMLLRPGIWVGWMEKIAAEGVNAAPVMGMLALAFGAFIISGHPVYSGTALLVTVIGYLVLFKGLTYLLFPNIFVGLTRWFSDKGRGWVRPMAIFALVLGVVILWVWGSWPVMGESGFQSYFSWLRPLSLPPGPVTA